MSISSLIVDGSGNGFKAQVTKDNALKVISTDPEVVGEIVIGKISTSSVSLAKVLGTTYTEQSSNAQRSVASNNVNDVQGGTGAQSIKITYFTQFFEGPREEIVLLNGTTFVPTQNNDICYIQNIKVVSADSGNTNAGIISLFVNNSGDGGTIGTIAVADTQTFWGHYYVGGGQKINILAVTCGSDTNLSGYFLLKSKLPNQPEIQITENIFITTSGSIIRPIVAPIILKGPIKIISYIKPSSASGANWFSSFDVRLFL
jgi:hypothetical protein